MEKFTKITVGFITQSYERNVAGKFKCTRQEFIAGDSIDYEDTNGNTITALEYDYQPFEMTLLSDARIAGAIEDVLLSINVGSEQSRQFAVEIDMLKKLLNALGRSANKPEEAKLGFLETQLFEACKTVTSYTMELLYKLDDQVNLGDVEELQQARDVIDRYNNLAIPSGKLLIECFISEQCSDAPGKKLPVTIMAEHGKLWIQPAGYGDKTSADWCGWPIGLEIWEDRLRLIVFDNINVEEPKIIDLEKAKEAARIKCNWCDKEVGSESVKWNGLLFCSQSCLDKCRAAQ